jgi:hypothetical protein
VVSDDEVWMVSTGEIAHSRSRAWLGSGCAETSCHQRVRRVATMAVVGALATS